MRQVNLNVYTFDELKEESKEVARQWYRDTFWSSYADDIIEDLVNMLKEKFGIIVEDKSICWTDVYSQGYCAYIGKGYFEDDWKAIELAMKDDMKSVLDFILKYKSYIDFPSMKITGNDFHRMMSLSGLEFFVDIDDLELESRLEEGLNKAEYALSTLISNVGVYLTNEVRKYTDDFMINNDSVDETISINEWEFTEDGKIYHS